MLCIKEIDANDVRNMSRTLLTEEQKSKLLKEFRRLLAHKSASRELCEVEPTEESAEETIPTCSKCNKEAELINLGWGCREHGPI
jgi:hypothetical protein